MSKILSSLLLLAGLVFFAFLAPPVQAVDCPNNSGDNGCDYPWTTCDDQACTQNCISTCGSGMSCTDLGGNSYCASLQPSCPAGCTIQESVQCNESSGNCYSTCACDGQTVDYTGSSPGGQAPVILPPGDFTLDAPATYCASQGQQNAKVYLEWSQSANADYYKVFLGGQGGQAIQKGRDKCVGEETFLDPDQQYQNPSPILPPGSRTYAIQAIRDDAHASSPNNCDAAVNCDTSACQTWSNEVTVYAPDCSAPPAVSLLAKKKGDTAASQHYHSGNPLVIDHQSQATLNWTSSNATFCQGTLGDNSWIGAQPTSSGGVDTATLNGPATYIYDLYCYNTKGESGHDYIQINVSPPPSITAWIQTLLGNVHSNLRIDAPGGP